MFKEMPDLQIFLVRSDIHTNLISFSYSSCLIKFIFRLHRMHEMHTIVTDDHGVCLSVCLSVKRLNLASLCKNGRTHQDAVWGGHSRGPSEHCVRWGSDPPQ